MSRAKTLLTSVLWIVVYLAISFGIGQMTRANMDWYYPLEKSALNPPNVAFPLVWTALYVLLALCGAKLWGMVKKGSVARSVFGLYALYMILNWAWSFVFFYGHQITAGFYWIVLADLILIAFIVKAWKNARICSLFCIPTLLWGIFAAYLNYAIMVMN